MRRAFLKGMVALGIVGLLPTRASAHIRAPKKKRPCDGICCHNAPLRRLGIENECEFHDHTMQFDVNSGCRLMADEHLLDGLSKDELRRFSIGCLGYPFLYRGNTAVPGECCYDWHGTN
jgi:hypothetical protein